MLSQKAAKQTAHRNAHVLNRAHLTSAIIHAIFLALRLLFGRLAWSSLALYLALVSPSLLIEFWLERLGRPRYVPGTKDLIRSGEDMDARGLTEYLWDVLYWTWGCTILAAVVGDWAWWSWVRFKEKARTSLSLPYAQGPLVPLSGVY